MTSMKIKLTYIDVADIKHSMVDLVARRLGLSYRCR